MRLKNASLIFLCLFIKPQDNHYFKLDKIPTDEIMFNFEIKQNVEIKKAKEQTQNLLCDSGKYITYTNIDNINLNNFYLNDYYIDDNGYVRECGTNAIYCAMATTYKKNNYYTITTNDNKNFTVKVVDVKSNEHTTNACFTTHDNSILELWITNKNNDFKNLGNSKVVNVNVIEIKE